MRRIIRAAAPTGLLAAVLGAVLAAGCSAAAPAPYRATVDTCYAFGVRALQRHITVATVPRACHGLSHAQVNLAAARAVREVVGPRPKAAARRLANKDSAYLGHLIGTVPPSAPASLATGPAQSSTDRAASLAALAAWILTAAAGSYLLAGWFLHGGLRRRPTRADGLPPLIILSHFGLAVAGLGIWIAFVVTDLAALAWTAVGLILPAAGLGMATLAAALPDPAPSASPDSIGPGSIGPGSTRPDSLDPGSLELGSLNPGSLELDSPGPGSGGPGPTLATRIAQTAAPARVRMPVTVIAVHGVFATVTILLVLLAAIGAA